MLRKLTQVAIQQTNRARFFSNTVESMNVSKETKKILNILKRAEDYKRPDQTFLTEQNIKALTRQPQNSSVIEALANLFITNGKRYWLPELFNEVNQDSFDWITDNASEVNRLFQWVKEIDLSELPKDRVTRELVIKLRELKDIPLADLVDRVSENCSKEEPLTKLQFVTLVNECIDELQSNLKSTFRPSLRSAP